MQTNKHTKAYIAIPLLDELDNLPSILSTIEKQDCSNYEVFFCVNQPDAWWGTEKRDVCERNVASIEYLEKNCNFPFQIIDKASRGNGWQGKQLGVGWARKLVMDAINDLADVNDILITLDGDTGFNPTYFSSVLENFNAHPEAVGLSVPYYHPLSGSESEDRAILRYEIYMRNYAINLWRIANPYNYTALGSAMALPIRSYRTIGGMTPKKSGEDFYFLQKLRKYGYLLTWNKEKVYPAARFSDRVFFGTGPAMIKGSAGDWNSYPVYHHSLFEHIMNTYSKFDELFDKDVSTPLDDFISNVLKQKNIWEPLRQNAKTIKQFRRACRDKIDGLRILQFLKHSQTGLNLHDEDCLLDLFSTYYPDEGEKLEFLKSGFTFDDLSIEQLDEIRNVLAGIEESYQRNSMYHE